MSSPTPLPTEISLYRISLAHISAVPFTGLQRTTSAPPAVPPGHVLLKMHAAALSHRDLLVARNSPEHPPPTASGLIPVLDGAGTVRTGTARFPAGTRVFLAPNTTWQQGGDVRDCDVAAHDGGGAAHGVLAQYVAVREEKLVRVPQGMGWAPAAALGTAYATAWNALFCGPAPVRPGDVVLTMGSGGVSIAALQLAVAAGATVVATSSCDEKLEVLRALGAAHAVNYRETPEWGAEVRRVLGGRGVDHVVDVGGAGTVLQSVRAARQGGVVSLVGFVGGLKAELGPEVVLEVIFGGKTLRGVLSASKMMVEDMARAVEARGVVPYVGKVFKWEQAKAAYDAVAAGEVGRVVIEIAE
ncbi:alcohol dehydrogenase [Geopyxis carbonaria]|nr:alcohol dehydrogenase [Geopyxis carbonaria]